MSARPLEMSATADVGDDRSLAATAGPIGELRVPIDFVNALALGADGVAALHYPPVSVPRGRELRLTR